MTRIVVVMPNWFGETLFATPFVRALRSQLPNAFIAALGVERACEVLQGNPCLNELVRFETSLMALPLIHRLRSRQFDTAIILRRSLTRSLLLCLAGIPRQIGFANPKSGWLLDVAVAAPTATLHKARTYLSLLGSLDMSVDGPSLSYEYHPTAEEREQASALLRARGVTTQHPMIVVHPGANWPHKRWSVDRFAQLAQRLGQDGTVVMTGGPEDRPLVQAIARQMTRPPVILAGETSLRQLAACLERADVVVSNDTGVLHIACALRRSVVALYGPTSPALTGPLGDPSRTIVIHHEGCCPTIPCLDPHHPGFPGMEAITVDEVADAVRLLLFQSLNHSITQSPSS
ncbi:MAG: lipopolysaccharide heptosyltransferase II [Candidatus Omnitrophica bacterium]|nr:lipopolysaccharide heptosyltransferase II [Candidatus Omnitrophota bacterium]